MKTSQPDRWRHSLSGTRVLVGRARHQAGILSGQLRTLGAKVLEIPFIEIRRPKSFKLLDTALKNLAHYDWLILTSVNGVDAMWARMEKLNLAGLSVSTHSATNRRIRVAAIGPATRKSIEQHGWQVDVVPAEYVAESVVRSLRSRVKGKRVLLVRAKVARDVIPRELRRAGASVDVVEAYETVLPRSSRTRLRRALRSPQLRPDVITFTSSSTVRNFVALLDPNLAFPQPVGLRKRRPQANQPLAGLDGIKLASIGPVTSSTLRELGLRVDIQAKEFTIPGLIKAIRQAFA